MTSEEQAKASEEQAKAVEEALLGIKLWHRKVNYSDGFANYAMEYQGRCWFASSFYKNCIWPASTKDTWGMKSFYSLVEGGKTQGSPWIRINYDMHEHAWLVDYVKKR